MEIKILQVFYGKDGLPYKDKDRQVHFPIAGTGFLGASNTTKIKFYYDELDNLDETSWVAVSKLPNGKVGSRVLESYLDEELNEHYALLELDNYYTQYKGDVFISLQGYQGGVDFDYDEENSQYEIHGTPTIAATGSIKFTINYANQFIGSGETDNINFQRILAALGTKLGMRAYSEHVEELPSEGSPDVFYVVNDDPNNPNLANIYVWNENTGHYIWVGDNTLDLGEYYTKNQGEQFEQDIRETIGNGSPKGVYATLEDLQTAYPTGTNGIYVVSANGHWYFWNGSAWTDGGVYQTAANYDFLEDTLEIATGNKQYQFIENQRIAYNDLGSSISPVQGEASVRIECNAGDVFYVKGYGGVNGRLWAFADNSFNNIGDSGPLLDTNGEFIKIIAPSNVRYLICNSYNDVTYQLIKNKPLKEKVDDLQNYIDTSNQENEKLFDDLADNRKLFQYVKSTEKISNMLYLSVDSDGNVTSQTNSSCDAFPSIHLDAGTYSISKINAYYSFIVFDDLTTKGNFDDVFPNQGSGTNRQYLITLTQGATIYPTITKVDGFTTLMIVSGEYLPNDYVEYGEYIYGLNSSLLIGNHTLEDVDELIDSVGGEQNTPFMYIKNGKVTSNGQLAEYAQVDMGSKITKIMARCVWARNSTSVATLIAMKNNNENINGPVANIGQGSIHINWSQNEVAVQYFSPDGVNHNIAGYSYTSCIADGETEYEFGYEFLGNDTIRFYLPDGTTRDLTNANFDVNNGNFFVFETSGTQGNTADILFTGVFCSCESGTYLRDNFKRANGPLGVANTGHTYRVFKSQRTSIFDF